MAEDDQARSRQGGLDMEITVEEPPARVKRASEPSGPVQTDAADPQEPSPEDTEEGPGGDGDAQGGNRLTALVGKLRDKAQREGDEPASQDDEAAPDPGTEPERAEDRPAARASGFTILSYRSGPGQNGDPPIPGRQKTTPPEVEEPEPVDEAPEIEQPDEGMTDAPPIPADDIETEEPEDQVTIEMEEPAAEVVEPDQAPEEEALEAHDEPEAEEPADSPGLFARLRSKLSRSKADAIEVPTAMPAPPPTPPLVPAEVEVVEEPEETEEVEDSPGLFARLTGKASGDEEPEPEQEPEPEPAASREPAKKGGFFSRLKEKVSRSGSGVEDPAGAELDQPPTPPTGDRQPEIIAAIGRSPEPKASDLESLEATIEAVEAEAEPEPEQASEPEPATAEEPDTADADTEEEPAKKGGFFSRLKEKVSRSGSGVEDPAGAELDQPPTPPTGDRQPEIIAAIGRSPEPEPATAEEPAKKGGFLSRLKEKVSGADQEPEDQAIDEPEEAPAPSTPLGDPHDDAVEGGPEVPPTGDRHPELIAAMSTETQTVEEPEEPDTVDADTEEEPAKKGGLFSRLKEKVAGSEEPAPEEVEPAEPSAPGSVVAEDPEPKPVEAEEPPETPEPPTVEADRTEPATPETAIDRLSDEALETDGDGELPYEEIVRRVEILLERRREDPEKSAAREKVRILAGGSKR